MASGLYPLVGLIRVGGTAACLLPAAPPLPVSRIFGLTARFEMPTTNRPPLPQPANDRAELARLVPAIATGDRGALAEVYDRTSGKLFGICLRLLGNRAEAEDVLQDVYVTLWRKASQFDMAKASPITWLSVMARNKAIDRLRQRRDGHDDLGAAANVVDDAPSSFEIVSHHQQVSRLADCLDELDERSRAMIRAAFLDGQTYSLLAERESVPLGTMKSWIRRGLQHLRGCLEL
jgi:RNA polymerase sigma factor (sigma-70 family)